VALGVAVVVVVTAVLASGMRRSNRANAAIVSCTLLSLLAFVLAGLPTALERGADHFDGAVRGASAPDLLHATALMFVAYTGYARIATLGEEIRDPARSIPRAIGWTLLGTTILYVAVVTVAVATVGADALAAATEQAAAPLEIVARQFAVPEVSRLVAIGAVTAMGGVLLNLLLGLSRVLLAMGRRGDMPGGLARVDERGASPRNAVVVTGIGIAGLTLIGSVETTWSFSAFTVLVYYALTNLAALRLPAGQRRYSRAIPALGLVGCLGLAFWVEPRIWIAGLALIALGLAWHALARRTRL
jgi:APA family basic amino acid/polyamine antiporter